MKTFLREYCVALIISVGVVLIVGLCALLASQVKDHPYLCILGWVLFIPVFPATLFAAMDHEDSE